MNKIKIFGLFLVLVLLSSLVFVSTPVSGDEFKAEKLIKKYDLTNQDQETIEALIEELGLDEETADELIEELINLKYPKSFINSSPVGPNSCPEADLLNPSNRCYDASLKNMGKGTRFDPEYPTGSLDLDGDGLRSDPEDHRHFGVNVRENEDLTGIFAKQQCFESLVLESGDWLFAPTLLGINDCPIEIVTFYSYENDEMKRLWAIYDHHVGGWMSDYEIDRDDYHAWAPYSYFTYHNSRIVWNDVEDEWEAQLYNWYTSEWEVKYHTSESKDSALGWSMWEEWGFYDDEEWPDIKTIRGKDIQVLDDDTWEDVTSNYGYQLDNTKAGFPYDYEWYHEKFYYYWKVFGL